jgi:hypothetical protein
MRRIINVAWLGVVLASGYLAGYSIAPGSSVAAQGSGDPNLVNGQHQPPEWKTSIPAPQLRQPISLWPNQPKNATYWSISDIRNAHQMLSDADKSGKKIDPNSTLHDFPYWTRTHSCFVMHRSDSSASGNAAEQHAGYSQFIVIMGGTGTIVAGGEMQKKVTLSENGQQIPGEYRSPSISGGTTFTVKEGDWVSIPPGTPAQFKPNAGGLTYMAMKVNAMLYPWDLIR